MTGAGYEPTLPKGESDGPPGAASLARILYRGLGAVPVFVNEAVPRRSHRRVERGRRPDGEAVRAGARSPSRRRHRERAGGPVEDQGVDRRDLRQVQAQGRRLGRAPGRRRRRQRAHRDRPAAHRAEVQVRRLHRHRRRRHRGQQAQDLLGRHRRSRQRVGLRHDLQHGREDHAQGQGARHRREDRRGDPGDDVELGLLRHRGLPRLPPEEAASSSIRRRWRSASCRPASTPAGWRRCTARPSSWSTASTAKHRWPACSSCRTSCASTRAARRGADAPTPRNPAWGCAYCDGGPSRPAPGPYPRRK